MSRGSNALFTFEIYGFSRRARNWPFIRGFPSSWEINWLQRRRNWAPSDDTYFRNPNLKLFAIVNYGHKVTIAAATLNILGAKSLQVLRHLLEKEKPRDFQSNSKMFLLHFRTFCCKLHTQTSFLNDKFSILLKLFKAFLVFNLLLHHIRFDRFAWNVLVKVDSFSASPKTTWERSWSRQSFWRIVVECWMWKSKKAVADFRFYISCCGESVGFLCRVIALKCHSASVSIQRHCRLYFADNDVQVWRVLMKTDFDLNSLGRPCSSVFLPARMVSCLCWWCHWNPRSHFPLKASPCCRCGRDWLGTVAEKREASCWRRTKCLLSH